MKDKILARAKAKAKWLAKGRIWWKNSSPVKKALASTASNAATVVQIYWAK